VHDAVKKVTVSRTQLYEHTINDNKSIQYMTRQLYKNISMLFLFPVKDGKLSTGVNAQRFLSCYG